MAVRLLSSFCNVLTKRLAGLQAQGLQRNIPVMSSVNVPAHRAHPQLHTAAWTEPYTPTSYRNPTSHTIAAPNSRLLLVPGASAVSNQQPVRMRITCNRRNGKPRTVYAVIRRFFRLHNGMWIRTKAGRHKKLWKKDGRRVKKMQEHVFCTQRQCWMLDQMVNPYYRTRKFYPNDPYEHYHTKTNLPNYNYIKPRFLP